LAILTFWARRLIEKVGIDFKDDLGCLRLPENVRSLRWRATPPPLAIATCRDERGPMLCQRWRTPNFASMDA
jgi:hypothetical protein